jgi:hypothetical protein
LIELTKKVQVQQNQPGRVPSKANEKIVPIREKKALNKCCSYESIPHILMKTTYQ